MNGFPNSKGQNDLLSKTMKIKPALIFVLEQGEDESVRRLQNKQLDPETGAYYNIEIQPAGDDTIQGRLVQQDQDQEAVVRAAFKQYREDLQKFEEAWRHAQIITL